MANDGGAAFPMPACEGEHGPYEGMTLRDYFAAHAPAPPEAFWKAMIRNDQKTVERLEAQAKWRYQYADAMIAARGRMLGDEQS